MFAKVFEQIFDSSISEDYLTRLVFEDLLVLADQDGVVDKTQEAIARRTNVPVDIVKTAINKLQEPDPKSRNPDHEGRRIVLLDEHRDWGWCIVNYEYYRKLASEEQRRERTRERVKRFRDKSIHKCNADVTLCNDSPSASAYASVSNSVQEGECERETWRTSFEIYKASCKEAFLALSNDSEYITCQQRFYPGVDIKLSLDKSYTQFWGTEAGWKHKRKSRAKEIDWKTTLTKALDFNKVWMPRTAVAATPERTPMSANQRYDMVLNSVLIRLREATVAGEDIGGVLSVERDKHGQVLNSTGSDAINDALTLARGEG